jgi:carbon monoxide dehydrogenase subunit G
MKIEGATDISAPRDRVWSAFLDPAVIAKAIPGCEELVSIGPDEYKAVMKVGVGPVKGTFDGKVRLFDQDPPHRYRMAVEGSGAPGFVRGEATLELTEAPGGTRVACSGDIQVGGLIASVGQRLLGGVSRMMLDQFFSRMNEILTAPQ